MTSSFKCASCSAPLEFEGEMMQKCDHCGSTVIAPSELFQVPGTARPGNAALNTGGSQRIAEIQRLINAGKKIEAIKVFRETFGSGLKEAKDAVEALERGQSIDISGMQVRTVKMPTINVDGAAVRKVGMTVGGTIVAAIVIGAVFIAGVIGLVLYFSLSRRDSAPVAVSNTSTNGSAQPGAVGGEAAPAKETMRIGGDGGGPGQFKDNRHVAVDGNGRIYSSDYSPIRVQVFDAEGKFINQWKPEAGSNLYGLGADRNGSVFIANEKGIFKYEGESGKLIASAENIYPQGLAVTWDGKVVVTGGKTIGIYDPGLKLIKLIKDAAEQANSDLGFSIAAVDGEGNIFTIDRRDRDVCKFSPEGKFLNRFHVSGSPNSIAVDRQGRIFVSNTSSIKIVDAGGTELSSFSATQAFGLAFGQNGELFVASRPYVVKMSLEF